MEKKKNKKVEKTKIDEKPRVKRIKKKKKGFTLIELLAVIVILGLLMAIAIPSVTKYITESRKKTVTTTVSNYIGALVNEVNDLSYTFTGQNTIYAVPIECIALERGGTSPFGEWYQANDAYFAYVLIQYDDQNSKYVYGFTFKDSAGYGLYPTIQSKIKEKGSQIKTGLDLNRPVSGDLTSLTTLAKWQQSGFEVDSTTNFQVLEATSEGEIGDGETTCTLCQKGKNYAQVEEEKDDTVPGSPTIAQMTLESFCTDMYKDTADPDDPQNFEFDFDVGMTWREWFNSSYNDYYRFTNDNFPLSGHAGIFDAEGAGICCDYVFSGINGGTISLDSVIKPGNYRLDKASGSAMICWE